MGPRLPQGQYINVPRPERAYARGGYNLQQKRQQILRAVYRLLDWPPGATLNTRIWRSRAARRKARHPCLTPSQQLDLVQAIDFKLSSNNALDFTIRRHNGFI